MMSAYRSTYETPKINYCVLLQHVFWTFKCLSSRANVIGHETGDLLRKYPSWKQLVMFRTSLTSHRSLSQFSPGEVTDLKPFPECWQVKFLFWANSWPRAGVFLRIQTMRLEIYISNVVISPVHACNTGIMKPPNSYFLFCWFIYARVQSKENNRWFVCLHVCLLMGFVKYREFA